MSLSFNLPYWYDLHTHLRQDEILPHVINSHIKAKCNGVLAMPNTVPPVGKIYKKDSENYISLEEYISNISEYSNGKLEHIIVPLYLTKNTTIDMIQQGVNSKLLKACKYYPPFGTTNADFGCNIEHFIHNGVLKEMEKQGVVLCIHGEEVGISNTDYFDKNRNAEEIFYKEIMPLIIKKFPNLKIVCEHITTEVAVEFVYNSNKNVSASITPQHLLYTVADLLRGCKYHLYCLPLLKFESDRDALRKAVTSEHNFKFFAGTDSAPHFRKVTECGCAAGCFTAEVAPQMYLDAFEQSGLDFTYAKNRLIFENFLCRNGAIFYNLPISRKSFTVIKKPSKVDIISFKGGQLTPLPVGLNNNHNNEPTMLNWSII